MITQSRRNCTACVLPPQCCLLLSQSTPVRYRYRFCRRSFLCFSETEATEMSVD